MKIAGICFLMSILFSGEIGAQVTKAQVRDLFLNKQIKVATDSLRTNHKKILTQEKDIADVAKWMSAFQKENSLSSYELALEKEESDPEKAKSLFIQVMESEPHNKTVITAYVAFLIGRNEVETAQGLLSEKAKEFPYLYVYNILQAYIEAFKGNKLSQALACDRKSLDKNEAELCYYIKFKEKLNATPGSVNKMSTEIARLYSRLTIPNKHLLVWQKYKISEEKKNYLTACQSLSDKDKKNYKIVPALCSKVDVPEDKDERD